MLSSMLSSTVPYRTRVGLEYGTPTSTTVAFGVSRVVRQAVSQAGSLQLQSTGDGAVQPGAAPPNQRKFPASGARRRRFFARPWGAPVPPGERLCAVPLGFVGLERTGASPVCADRAHDDGCGHAPSGVERRRGLSSERSWGLVRIENCRGATRCIWRQGVQGPFHRLEKAIRSLDLSRS